MLQMMQGLALGQDTLLQLVKPAVTVPEPVASDSVTVPKHRRNPTHNKQVFGARTPPWLSNTIWQLALNRSISGWQFTMRTYGVVAKDAHILKTCRDGDIVEMQRLFDTRVASPFDQDEYGSNLWDLGILDANIGVLRILLAYGVEPNQQVISYDSFWYSAMLSNHTADDLRKDLQFPRELYDDNQHHIANYCDIDEAATRLALCPPDEEIFLRLRYNCIPIVPHPFADLLTRYDPKDMNGNTQLQLLAGFYSTILAASMHVVQAEPIHARADVEELLVMAISMGLSIHVGSSGTTPLQTVLRSFTDDWKWVYAGSTPPTKLLNKALFLWLKILQRADVDLTEYGREEERLRKARQSMRISSPFAEMAFPFQFTYGPRPLDWSVAPIGFVEECSGYFWQLVEAQLKRLRIRSTCCRVDGSRFELFF